MMTYHFVSISGLTAYKFAVYVLLVRDGFGHGIPVGYIICSSESDDNLQICFSKFKEGCGGVAPRYKKLFQNISFACFL